MGSFTIQSGHLKSFMNESKLKFSMEISKEIKIVIPTKMDINTKQNTYISNFII